MRAPGFWQDGGLTAWVLTPAGWVYGMIGALRLAASRPHIAGRPVICVGNLVAGGQGKTPVALAIADRLAARDTQPWFLTRGYGGTLTGPVRVDSGLHDATLVGDEALLLAKAAPTVLGRDRISGAALAVTGGADAIIMDDGFQNPSLHKDLSLLVVDGGTGYGNRRLIPAGPLREPIRRGIARADAVVMIGADVTGAAACLPPNLPVIAAELAPGPTALALAGRRVIAFAGIGRPEKFFETLERVGAEIVARQSFADHHPYRPAELDALTESARRQDAILVTTAKDAVRLPPEMRARVIVVGVTLRTLDPGAIDRLLDRVLT